MQTGERVLSRGQNDAFERLMRMLGRPTPVGPSMAPVRGSDGGSAAAEHTELHLHSVRGYSMPQDVVRALNVIDNTRRHNRRR